MLKERAARLQHDWGTNPRWDGVERTYSAEDVIRLRGSIDMEYTIANRGSRKLWNLLNKEEFINSLGALTGNQAVQQVKAGLKAIYLSGWQVAADANMAGEDRKSTRLNSSHVAISYAVFCLKKKNRRRK